MYTSHASHIFTITTLPHTIISLEKPFIISFIALRFIQPKMKNHKITLLDLNNLSVLMLCAPAFIFASSSSAHIVVYQSACCYLLYLIHFSEFVLNCLHENMDKTRTSLPFSYDTKNVCQQLLDAQSINTERAPLTTLLSRLQYIRAFCFFASCFLSDALLSMNM